ncbi:MAG: histidine phosphatase family protein [Bacteroidales bacterium]|nr:histidine phosphatase family protein [Bacteroidales bacterium]
MKTLYLVRHAKASWDESGLSDFDRPLLPKGIKKTNRIVGFLQKRNTQVDLIISSPAVRALETAKIIAAGLDYPSIRIRTEQKIFNGYHDRILDIIYDTRNDIQSLMIVGHNPAITLVANLFLHPGIEIMPTTGVVCLSFNIDTWAEIPSTEAIREFIMYPKLLE